MAVKLPDLRTGSLEEKTDMATKKAISLLRSKCVDEKMYRSEFELEVNSIFSEYGIQAETEDYDKIEIELNNLDCHITERFMNFDKFISSI